MKTWVKELALIQDVAQERFGHALDEIVCDQEIFELAFSCLFDLMPGSTQSNFAEEEHFVSFCWENRRQIARMIWV